MPGRRVTKGVTAAPDLTERERAFVGLVWQQGKKRYRDLPWRNCDDAYAVLVSEVMLQQTQVSRVLGYWERFLGRFPTLDALAAAPVAEVLSLWQGLGYNRRALMLKRCAEMCAEERGGCLPKTAEELTALPGIGKATAAGVCAFAYQQPCVYLETNVRTVFLHELFCGEVEVPDAAIEPLVRRTCSVDDPRGWYYALLDYGSYLKSVLPNPSRRSRHHARQSAFEGSRRQKRAECVRFMLAEREATLQAIYGDLAAFEAERDREPPDPELVRSILNDLVAEGFFATRGDVYQMAP